MNLVCENSIEHRMLGLLSQKQQLADAVREAVELALKESAYLSGEYGSGAGDAAVSLSFLETRLVPERFLPDNAIRTVAKVRDFSPAGAQADERTARSLIRGSKKLLEHVDQSIQKSLLG
ncbi:MAG: hypothetical protein JXL84_01080 [Deltaproteobacteria bacterium]|nr:hypothetical protein [Deltaproteobacteria bacterium]